MPTIAAYIGAALFEIAGCFAFWGWLRLGKPIWWLAPGLVVLARRESTRRLAIAYVYVCLAMLVALAAPAALVAPAAPAVPAAEIPQFAWQVALPRRLDRSIARQVPGSWGETHDASRLLQVLASAHARHLR